MNNPVPQVLLLNPVRFSGNPVQAGGRADEPHVLLGLVHPPPHPRPLRLARPREAAQLRPQGRQQADQPRSQGSSI